jgi:hypothetical protein
LLRIAITIVACPRRSILPNHLPPGVVNHTAKSAIPAAPPPAVVLRRIETERKIAARLELPRQELRWRVVGDDDLFHILAPAGHPAGLVRMNGRAILLLR